MIKNVVSGLLGVSLLLAAAVAVHTLRQASRQLDVPLAPALQVDERGVAERLYHQLLRNASELR